MKLMDWLVDLAIYVANSGLFIIYVVVDTAPWWLSLSAATFIALTFDRWAQLLAVYAPSRYAKTSTPVRPPRTAQITTGIAVGLWLIATWSLGPPVTLIGAVMWWVAALALAVMPQQRWSLLWTTKAGMVLYSIAILGYRLYLWQASRLSPAQLADVFGGQASAAQIIAQNTGTFATVGAWLLWAVMPAGYISVLVQNWAAQPMSLVNPLAGMRDVLAQIRTRGNHDSASSEASRE
ncbi:MAG: hypothetical protein FJ030_19765 [Chloroflexi bacterium]|nr:hypothetical protein [Chloroflexota bacterium]